MDVSKEDRSSKKNEKTTQRTRKKQTNQLFRPIWKKNTHKQTLQKHIRTIFCYVTTR